MKIKRIFRFVGSILKVFGKKGWFRLLKVSFDYNQLAEDSISIFIHMQYVPTFLANQSFLIEDKTM